MAVILGVLACSLAISWFIFGRGAFPNGSGSKGDYQDIIKLFSAVSNDTSVSINDKDDQLKVIVTYNGGDGNAVPAGWSKMVSNFTVALSKGNDLAKDYGFQMLLAEFRANDGAVLAGGGNGERTFTKFPADEIQVTGDVITVSAKDLWKAYEENKVNADNLYKGKKLAVTGTVLDIGQDIVSGAPCVSLDTGGSICLYPIQCFFPKYGDQNDKIASLSDGDTITVFGTCVGAPIAPVQLSDCYL